MGLEIREPAIRQAERRHKAGGDVFLPPAQKADYLREHGIRIIRLDNGAMLFGASGLNESPNYAISRMNFPAASFQEPQDKQGITHFLEHLTFERILHTLKNPGVTNWEASTSPSDVWAELDGLADPAEKNYGIWPLISPTFAGLTKPFNLTEERLTKEKQIVLDEMKRAGAGSGADIRRHSTMHRMLYHPNHPDYYDSIGTAHSIEGFTVQDLEAYHQRLFIPRSLEVSVFVNGNPAATNQLLDRFGEQVLRIPDNGLEPLVIDERLSQELDPDFQEGRGYALPSYKAPFGRQLINFAWLFPTQTFSEQHTAQKDFIQAASNRFHSEVRSRGKVYHTHPIDDDINDETHMIGLAIEIPKAEDPIEEAQSIFQETVVPALESFDPASLENLAENTRTSSTTHDISRYERFTDAVTGIKRFGRIIDPGRKTRIARNVDSSHYQAVIDHIKDTPVTVFVDGDVDITV